eukprot:TRINITY_DN7806_c0_g4_i1.p1 TRINITY_DN7806_c0_g4~~TRINITY_DN7806_c0_g4_i1.p1  ORF type:complete len:642 (-),score=192.97 TRINITY_DN7806_c0_g4_i1:256-2181(-)
MKFAVAIVLAALSCFSHGEKFTESSTVDFDHLRKSVVRIQTVSASFDWFHPFNSGSDGVSLGTGFIIQTDPYILVATNQHVINDASQVTVQLLLYGERQWTAEVVATCPKFDLALFVLKDDKAFKAAMAEKSIVPKALELSEEVAAMGQDVVAMGFPLGQETIKISKGNIAGNQIVNGNICIQSTAPISPGNSGGPLLDENAEKVVGVNFAKATTGENINYVIPAWRVKQMMNTHLKAQPNPPKEGEAWKRLPVKAPHHDLVTIESNDALAEMSGCKTGIYIARVRHRSFLNNAEPKIEAGSMLFSVGGVEVDRFGMGNQPKFIADKVSFADLFFMVPDLAGSLDFKTCKDGKVIEHKVSLAWKDQYAEGIRYVDEPFREGLNKQFETFGDLSVMQMTTNHISAVFKQTGDANIARWLHPDFIWQPRLVVTNVRSGSYLSDVISAGAVIDKINGNDVRTLEEFREHFAPNSDKKVWTLETDTGIVAAVMYKETVANQVKTGRADLLTTGVTNAAKKLGFIKDKSLASAAASEKKVEKKVEEKVEEKEVKKEVHEESGIMDTVKKALGILAVHKDKDASFAQQASKQLRKHHIAGAALISTSEHRGIGETQYQAAGPLEVYEPADGVGVATANSGRLPRVSV